MFYRHDCYQKVFIANFFFLFLSTATAFGMEHDSAVYGRLKTHIDSIKVINTHEHQDYWGDYSPENCSFYTLPVVDGFYWSTLQTVAGLRFKTTEGSEIEGGLPTVDDGTNGELTVRWPIHSPDGEVVITFNETCVSISTTGNVKDGWLLELSSDKKAKLPFGIIGRKKLSCTYKNIPYTILTKQGVFTKEPDSGLRIIPEDNRIVLDFSTIEKSM